MSYLVEQRPTKEEGNDQIHSRKKSDYSVIDQEVGEEKRNRNLYIRKNNSNKEMVVDSS